MRRNLYVTRKRKSIEKRDQKSFSLGYGCRKGRKKFFMVKVLI